MNAVSDAPFASDETVGVVLNRMRRAAGLTGGALARTVGMSQPKISRIERGQGLADPQDVGRIARALGADDDTARDLMNRAEGQHNRMADWRPTPVGLAGRQQTVAELEAAATDVRVFEPAVVVGLLQTSGYARAMMEAFQRVVAPEDGLSSPAVAQAVSARVRRQEILEDRTKNFHFVMTETVLRNRVCPPAEMMAQIARLRAFAGSPKVSVGFIPADAEFVIPPQHGFTMLDDRMVIMDLYNTGLTSPGRMDSRRYRQVFDLFEGLAVADNGPMLDRYEQLYLDLLRRPAAPGQAG